MIGNLNKTPILLAGNHPKQGDLLSKNISMAWGKIRGENVFGFYFSCYFSQKKINIKQIRNLLRVAKKFVFLTC